MGRRHPDNGRGARHGHRGSARHRPGRRSRGGAAGPAKRCGRASAGAHHPDLRRVLLPNERGHVLAMTPRRGPPNAALPGSTGAREPGLGQRDPCGGGRAGHRRATGACKARSPRRQQPSRSSRPSRWPRRSPRFIAASPRSGACAARQPGLPRRFEARQPDAKHRPTAPPAPGLSLRAVTVAAPGSATALMQPVDLHVAPGEMVALTGRSGLGKSTLLHAIAGLSQPLSGRITLDGSAPWTCPKPFCAPGWASCRR
jgi:hypothetical protein